MITYIYYGPFEKYIVDFIELKKSLGYKYSAGAANLKRFDTFTVEKFNKDKKLTKNIVMDWCRKKSYEKQQNLCSRASTVRQLAIFINNLGEEAYVIPKNHLKSGEKYVPHIYSKDELENIFRETDKCRYRVEFPYRHLIMPIFFRMVYSCGLRLSEARLLKVRDVDLNSGTLTIHQSKNDKSRLVPMTDTLTKRCEKYSKEVHLFSDNDRYYFPSINKDPVSIGNIYKNFRKFLWRAGISHGGKGYGPRVHDFRHSFAVHRLKRWSLEEKDLMIYLPVLRVYLGHDSFEETAYYLKLTADVFPHITLKLETIYPDLIPMLEGEIL